jgi:alkylation response protein AidB-like acyl-CoA dehydrogenase
MKFEFTPEIEHFRDEARAWLTENVPKGARPKDGPAMRVFDMAWQRRQHAGGWGGIAWPRDYGGRGLSLVQQMVWYEEYARCGAPVPGCMFVGLNHGGPTLIARGTNAQKSFHIPPILRGDVVWCQGFSEPSSGSDLGSIRTRGEIDGDHLVVTGQKIWTTHADVADYQELLVRTDPTLPKHKGLTWVICDMHLPGVSVVPIKAMTGAAPFCQVFYDEVRIPLSNVVSTVNDGWSVAMSTLSFERGTAMIPHQVQLQRTVEELIVLAHETLGADRRRPAIQDDAIAAELATLRAEVAAMRAMTYATISRGLREDVPGPESAIVYLYFGELFQHVHKTALDILGGAHLERSAATERWVYDYLESFKQTIAGGTSEIRRNIIGERVLGLPRGR